MFLYFKYVLCGAQLKVLILKIIVMINYFSKKISHVKPCANESTGVDSIKENFQSRLI